MTIKYHLKKTGSIPFAFSLYLLFATVDVFAALFLTGVISLSLLALLGGTVCGLLFILTTIFLGVYLYVNYQAKKNKEAASSKAEAWVAELEDNPIMRGKVEFKPCEKLNEYEDDKLFIGIQKKPQSIEYNLYLRHSRKGLTQIQITPEVTEYATQFFNNKLREETGETAEMDLEPRTVVIISQ